MEHRPAVNGKTKVELWGSDDRPIKVIKNQEEDLKEFLHLAPRFSERVLPKSRNWFGGMLVGVAVIGGWLAYRKRQR